LKRANNGSQSYNKLLLAKDRYGYKAWHRAAEGVNLETLDILWSWAKQVTVHRDKLKNHLYLVQNEERQAASYTAA